MEVVVIALSLLACTRQIEVVESQDPADLARDEVVCAGIRDPATGPSELVLIGMDSGTLVPVADPEQGGFAQVDGLALLGEHVAYCTEKLTRLEIATGEVERTEVRCDGVADVDGGLALFHPKHDGQWGDPIVWYPSWEDAVANSGGVSIGASPYATRLGRGDGELLTAWHSAHEIERWDAASGASLGRTKLERFDTWVWGLSAVGDRLFVANDGRDPGWNWNTRIAEFDADGNAVQDLRLGEHVGLHGLACTSELVDPLTSEPAEGTEGTVGTVVVGR